MNAVITEPGVYDMPEDARRVRVGGSHWAVVDAADYTLVADLPWYLLRGHNGRLYAYTSLSSRSVYMHRLIAGTQGGRETDHRNGDGLDNRRCNLRPATASQNRANMWKPRRPNGAAHTSAFKGVSWDKARGSWIAKITVLGYCRNLGRYDSEADAAHAYDAAALAAWDGFARLNFPEVAE